MVASTIRMEPRLSVVCFQNMKKPSLDQSEPQRKFSDVSPTTPCAQNSGNTFPTACGPQDKNLEQGSPSTVPSPVEQATYFSHDKILLTESVDKQCVEEPLGLMPIEPAPLPSKYLKTQLTNRAVSQKKSFWKKHMYWILGIIALLIILFSVVGVIISRSRSSKVKIIDFTRNNTRDSVACAGLAVNQSEKWNMFVFSQSSSGQIELYASLDGETFEPATNISLEIPARVGSPLSATAEQDLQTRAIMLNLFYISGINNLTMSALECAEGSANCETVRNFLLPTTIPALRDTGLAAVGVNSSLDWRVFYHDNLGYISQIQGNASGSNSGSRIGGQGLNGSDITAVNINSIQNNIHVFYTDMLTEALFTLQLQGNWTAPRPVSSARVANWNPYSGLGSAYRPSLDQLHVYFTGLDKGVYEFVLNGTTALNSTFQPQPDGSRPWAEADYEGADISAIGWKDQVRFFQPARGRLVMGELNNTSWGEVFVDMITTGSKIIA